MVETIYLKDQIPDMRERNQLPYQTHMTVILEPFGEIADWRVINITNKMISEEMELLPQFKLAFLKQKIDGYNE